jgi:hypothetical protein
MGKRIYAPMTYSALSFDEENYLDVCFERKFFKTEPKGQDLCIFYYFFGV